MLPNIAFEVKGSVALLEKIEKRFGAEGLGVFWFGKSLLFEPPVLSIPLDDPDLGLLNAGVHWVEVVLNSLVRLHLDDYRRLRQ